MLLLHCSWLLLYLHSYNHSLSLSTRLCSFLCAEKVFLPDRDRSGVDHGQPQPQPEQQVIHDKGRKVLKRKDSTAEKDYAHQS